MIMVLHRSNRVALPVSIVRKGRAVCWSEISWVLPGGDDAGEASEAIFQCRVPTQLAHLPGFEGTRDASEAILPLHVLAHVSRQQKL